MVFNSSGALGTTQPLFHSCLVNHNSPKGVSKPSWLSSRPLVHSCLTHLSADKTALDCTEELQSMFTNPFPLQLLPTSPPDSVEKVPFFGSSLSTITLNSRTRTLTNWFISLRHLYSFMFKLFLLITQTQLINIHKSLIHKK